jgi:hypothetical protein
MVRNPFSRSFIAYLAKSVLLPYWDCAEAPQTQSEPRPIKQIVNRRIVESLHLGLWPLPEMVERLLLPTEVLFSFSILNPSVARRLLRHF